MRRVVLTGAVMLALVPVAGAQSQSQSPSPFDHEPDPRIADGSAQRALAEARADWRRANVVSYRFRQRVSCFCPVTYTRPRTYEVRGGRVVRPSSGTRDQLATVPRLHRAVQDAIDEEVADLQVRYDRRGVPTFIARDGRRAIADDEISHTTDRFVVLRRRR